mmetsp:Transcript_117624/g.305224  ORF Transcript_117624/g.305224 Transcript_117624/m.305224 type:complete len:897 (+) Transcript_117624:2-2692(+)
MAGKIAPAEAASTASQDGLRQAAATPDDCDTHAGPRGKADEAVATIPVARTPKSRKSMLVWQDSQDVMTSKGCKRYVARCRKFLRPLLAGRVFKAVQVVTLSFALFGGSAWVLFDIPDDPGNAVLDALMLIVMVLFFLELIAQSIVEHREYPFSSFFWMDILGTFSMVFEISFMLGVAGQINTADNNMEGALLRAVRATKVAARAGRLTKILKCLTVMNLQNRESAIDANGGVQAKILSSKLMLTLSTKVSLLTVVLVLVVPLFQIGQYPEEDLSMRAWSQRIEDDYGRAYAVLSADSSATTSDVFSKSVEDMKSFYSSVYYQPFKVEGFDEQVTINGRSVTIPFSSVLSGKEPARKQNVVRKAVEVCVVPRPNCEGGDPQAYVYWNFTDPYMVTAGMDAAMIIFIIAVMALASANFNSTLDYMVVQPIESILTNLKSRASTLLATFGLEDDDEDEDHLNRKSETELLESIFGKLARLATLAANNNVTTEDEIAKMDEEGKGVMMDLMNVEVRHVPAASHDDAWDPSDSSPAAASTLPVDRSVVDSWDLDILSLDAEGQKNVVLFIFFDSHIGHRACRMWTSIPTFTRFHSVVKAGYNDKPYHNYPHACDVLHTTFRLVSLVHADKFLSEVDLHALLTAALCHDLGHEGMTNPFLVETQHDLALRYNDKSPLENMHCSLLFQICNTAETNVFEKAGKAEHKQARRVCISTILHTDNMNHMDMVRNISRFYEMHSEVCDAQAKSPNEFLDTYLDVVGKDASLFLDLFLHFADISNPLKPFPICKAWADRIIDEFFAQGDEEKRLGLPVGMLNDREKINRPGSQHGFINFLVAPLVISTVEIFACLHPLSTQMTNNLQTWRDLWVEDAKPSAEDAAKRDAEVKKLKETAERLHLRTIP